MTPTARLLAFAAAPPPLPPAVRATARFLIADTLAVGTAGRTAPGADAVLAAARRWGQGEDVPVLGRPDRLPAPSAAYVNGFQTHALEWDAVHEPAVVHALSVVTAAVHAVAQAAPIAEEAALEALVVGVEIACALGVAATGPLRFFRPATAGLMGASLAAARAAGLPAAAFADVLGLAHAQCAGTMQAHVEGSPALPLQIAHAARAAVTAVDLVRAGLTGPKDVLEGAFGHFALFEEGDFAPIAAALGIHWRTAEISFKPWPCGRASHGVLGALEGVRDPVAIEAHVPPLIHRLVGRPMDAGMAPGWARLSLPFLAALMLRDGRIDPRAFTPAQFADPALANLAARLTLVDDGNPDPNALGPQRVVLHFADGRIEERAIPITPGSPGHADNDRLAAAKQALAAELAAAPIPSTLTGAA